MAYVVEVEWRMIRGTRDDKWGCHQCLYAYHDPDEGDIFYVGKAGGRTIRERWNGSDKYWVKEWLDDGTLRRVDVYAGFPCWGDGCRYSAAKLADVESLLIMRLQPVGNRMSTVSRISRPGLRVVCNGNWPHAKKQFWDV